MILLGDFVIYVVFVFSVSVVVVSLLVTDPLLARAYGVPVGRRSGGGLAMTLVASINVIIFFFFGTSVRRSSGCRSDQKTYLAKVGRRVK